MLLGRSAFSTSASSDEKFSLSGSRFGFTMTKIAKGDSLNLCHEKNIGLMNKQPVITEVTKK
jgi:hypothetical protein